MFSIQMLTVILTCCMTIAAFGGAKGQDLPPCDALEQIKNSQSLFSVDTVPINSLYMSYIIESTGADGCFLNTTSIVTKMGLTAEITMKTVAITCDQAGTYVHLTPFDGERHSNVILYMHVSTCVVDSEAIQTMASMGSLKVLILTSTSLRDKKGTALSPIDYELIKDVVALYVEDAGYTGWNFLDLFDKNVTYPQMAEMAIGNMSWTNLPEVLSTLFPNLQALELQKNSLSSIPEIFPWTDADVLLPNNLSRTSFMQNHYSEAEFLDIPNNIFRRMYNLAYNNIVELCDQQFSGRLQKINLRGNSIQRICSNTFVNVTGLRNLDLSSNEISDLPPALFQGQRSLRLLNLMNNSVTNVSKDIFRDTASLEILNLANNSIRYIEPGAFVQLKKLRELHLQNNALVVIDSNCFPLDAIKLQYIYLNNNPLTMLPDVLFYIRGLEFADLKYTDITFDNFTKYLENLNDRNIFLSIVDSGSDGDMSDLTTQEVNPAVIDLSYSKVESLTLTSLNSRKARTFVILLLHFKFILTGNPLSCDCEINNSMKLINHLVTNKTIAHEDELFETWICQSPETLTGTPMVQVRPEQTLCPVIVEKCPKECMCYRRPVVERIVVDCENKNLEYFHQVFPEGTLELLYSRNNIKELKCMSDFDRVFSLDISNNKLKTISKDFFNFIPSIKELDLRSNLLAYLPDNIQKLSLQQMWLAQNPLHCDCNTKWMKYWLKQHSRVIQDWQLVTCTTDGNDRNVVADVRDDKFVCRDYGQPYDNRPVIITSTVSAVLGTLLVALLLLVYTFRLEVKVLLFMYFGIHPFDSDGDYAEEYIDCVIVHSGLETDWVMEKIVNVLENADHNFVVCDMARDFVVGYSFQENLTKTVEHSKRMIFLISNDWKPLSDRFAVAWGIAQGKIKQSRFNFGIIVTHEIQQDDIEDEDIRLFMKRGRSVDSSERLFENKILYYMPVHRYPLKRTSSVHRENWQRTTKVLTKCFLNKSFQSVEADENECSSQSYDNRSSNLYDTFISYGEEDLDFATKEIVPILEENNLKCCIPDRDFVVGASKEENILQAIAFSSKTIFIISPSHVTDEWSLFAFRAAYEKSLRLKSNHLIVIIKSSVNVKTDIEDEEMRHYINNYICLQETDRWFKKKLLTSLSTVTGMGGSFQNEDDRENEMNCSDVIISVSL